MKTIFALAAALTFAVVTAPVHAVALPPDCGSACSSTYNSCLNNCSIYTGSCIECITNYTACLSGCAGGSQASATPDLFADPLESSARATCPSPTAVVAAE